MRYPIPRPRNVSQWIKTVAATLALTALAGICGIACYNQVVVWYLSSKYSPPGRFVEVSGRRMHLHCLGTGTPSVILESGLGGSWLDWALVQTELSKAAQVCSYDRAGMGWSDPGRGPRSSAQIAAELDQLLSRAGVPPPYVLVGHSLGGLHIRVYAAKYPQKVAGLVFVDATHPREFEMLPAEVKEETEAEIKLVGMTKMLMASGMARLMGACDQIPPGAESIAPFVRIQACRVGRLTTIQNEYGALSLDRKQAEETGPFDQIPLLVLSHDPARRDPDMSAELHARVELVAEQMQQELTHLSKRGQRLVVPGSGHYVQLDRPDVVVGSIRTMVESVKKDR
jgi:pimeloyl-ACP methyl ester carboxylesterase